MTGDRETAPIEERFEPQRLGRLIARHLPECSGELELARVTTLGLRLSPGRECTGHFALDFRHRRTGEALSQNVLLHLVDLARCPPLTSRAVATYARLGLPIRTPETKIPELSAVLHPSALDPRLPSLVEALDIEALKPRLKRLLGKESVSLVGVRAKTISQTPGARATIRYRATVSDDAGARHAAGIIGKVSAHQRLAPVAAETFALWRETAGRFRQARPLGVIEPLNLSLQTLLEGQRLNATVADPDFPAHLRNVGAALACLHTAVLPLERTRRPAREVKSIESRARVLRTVTRDRARMVRLAERLAAEVQQRSAATGPVHADFHHANILVEQGDIAVIDLDEMSDGDPGLDAGRFPVSLSIPSLEAFGDLRLLDAGREHFLGSYLERTGRTAASVRIFEAIAFLASAATAWRLNRPGWRGHMEGFLDLSETALAEATRKPAAQETGAAVPQLSLDARRRWVADPTYVALLIKPAIHARHGADIESAALTKEVVRGQTLRLGWRLEGRDANGHRWRAAAAGVCRAGLRGRSIATAIDRLARTADGDAGALVLPAVLTGRTRLGLLMWEAQQAGPLDLTGGGRDDASALGRALAHLQRADTLDRKLRPPLDGSSEREGAVLTLREPHPAHIGAAGGRLILLRPERLSLGHASAAVLSLASGIAEVAGDTTARRFEDAYFEASGADRAAYDAYRSGAEVQRA